MITALRRQSRFSTLATIPLLLIALTGCGTQIPSGNAGDSTQGSLQWRLDFAACMRGEGIDVKDPGPNGMVAGTGPEDETPERQAATDKCMDEIGTPPVQNGGVGRQPVEQDQLRIAQCLREHGFDVADPPTDGSLQLPENLPNETTDACDVNLTGPVAPQ